MGRWKKQHRQWSEREGAGQQQVLELRAQLDELNTKSVALASEKDSKHQSLTQVETDLRVTHAAMSVLEQAAIHAYFMNK